MINTILLFPGDRTSNEHPRLCPKLEPGMGRNSPDNNRLQLPPGAGELPNHPPTRDDDQAQKCFFSQTMGTKIEQWKQFPPTPFLVVKLCSLKS